MSRHKVLSAEHVLEIDSNFLVLVTTRGVQRHLVAADAFREHPQSIFNSF